MESPLCAATATYTYKALQAILCIIPGPIVLTIEQILQHHRIGYGKVATNLTSITELSLYFTSLAPRDPRAPPGGQRQADDPT